jgi:hypothetical protein
MNEPLASFLSNLRAELSATTVRVVVDNAAPPAAQRTGSSPADRPVETAGWSLKTAAAAASRWQTDTPLAALRLPERNAPAPARHGPTMPRRRRSFDESDDDRFCQAVRECTIRGGDQRVLRMPQRVCSSELAAAAVFSENAKARCLGERHERACHVGAQ